MHQQKFLCVVYIIEFVVRDITRFVTAEYFISGTWSPLLDEGISAASHHILRVNACLDIDMICSDQK